MFYDLADYKHLIAPFFLFLILTELRPKSRSCCSRSSGAHDFVPAGAFHNLLFYCWIEKWFVPRMSFLPPHCMSSADHTPATLVLSQPCPSNKPHHGDYPLSLPRCCCSEPALRWSGCGHLGSGPSAHRCCTGDLCCSECTSTWAKKQRFQGQDTGCPPDTPRDKVLRSTALFTSTCSRHATFRANVSLHHLSHVPWCV